ncbi:MAG: hydrolase [Phycisphaeraceae bacterium]
MSDFKPTLDWIDAQDQAMRQLVRELADINSGSENLTGLATVAGKLLLELAKLPAKTQLLDTRPRTIVDARGNIIQQPLGKAIQAMRQPAEKGSPRVLLCIHYDTVFGVDHPFQKCIETEVNKLTGPGAVDAKGGIVVLLYALLALERSPVAGRIAWEVLLVPDEEIGSPGSHHLITEAAGRHDLGLLFEPALKDGTIVESRKGSGNFTITVHGRAAHAGRDSEKGRSAIHAAAEAVCELTAASRAIEGSTLNVGRIDGGGEVNVVADVAVIRFNVRVMDRLQQAAIERVIADAIARLNQKDGITAELHGSFHAPPKTLDDATRNILTRIVEAGVALKLKIGTCSTGGVSDGNKLAAAGLANVDTLGPRGGDLHSTSEYILLDSLTERAKLTALYLMKLAASSLQPSDQS